MILSIKNLVQGYGKKIVINDVNFNIDLGDVVTILGPNGSGKSTLIKTICNIMKPMSGDVSIDGVSISEIERMEFATKVAYVPQSSETFGYNSVFDTVVAGRRPYVEWTYTSNDITITADAMRAMGIDHLHDSYLSDVSGGQKQRAHIARALAQDSSFLILDEPTSSLDLRHQLETMTIMRKITNNGEKTAIVALHDLNLALNYSGRTIVLNNGKIYADGPSCDVITEKMIEDVYHVEAKIVEQDGMRFVHPIGPSTDEWR